MRGFPLAALLGSVIATSAAPVLSEPAAVGRPDYVLTVQRPNRPTTIIRFFQTRDGGWIASRQAGSSGPRWASDADCPAIGDAVTLLDTPGARPPPDYTDRYPGPERVTVDTHVGRGGNNPASGADWLIDQTAGCHWLRMSRPH